MLVFSLEADTIKFKSSQTHLLCKALHNIIISLFKRLHYTSLYSLYITPCWHQSPDTCWTTPLSTVLSDVVQHVSGLHH